jgi:hypothetical protein
MSSDLTKALAPYDNQKNTGPGPLPTKPFLWAIVGKKGCSKTTVVLNVLQRKESPLYRHFDLIFWVSPTAGADKKLEPLLEDIGEGQVYDDLNNDVIEDILAKCEAYTERHNKKKKRGDPQYCVVFDDCIHQIRSKRASLITRLATQNRHLKVSCFFLLQKWKSFPTIIRSNLDCITLFHNENEQEIKSFCSELGNEEKIRKMYEYATAEPYSFLHINGYAQPTRYYRRFDEIEFRK